MNILLFSDDEKLASFCREMPVEAFGPNSKLEVGSPDQLRKADEFWLWEFVHGEKGVARSRQSGALQKHIFLLRRQDLPAFRELEGPCNLSVPLKPDTSATLRARFSNADRHNHDEIGNA